MKSYWTDAEIGEKPESIESIESRLKEKLPPINKEDLPFRSCPGCGSSHLTNHEGECICLECGLCKRIERRN